MRKLDFSGGKVETLTVGELKQTYHEDLIDGTPVGGIYHYVLMERILELCEKYSLKPEVQEIFAANNRDSRRPGVTVLPQLAKEYGDGSLESHLLRRVYANIALRKDENDEFVTNLAVAYHQRGIQVGIGPMVKVCHNQTILAAQDVASTYSCFGNGRLSSDERSLEYLFTKVESWMTKYEEEQAWRMNKVEVMRGASYGYAEYLVTIGMLVKCRVTIDEGLVSGGVSYPLNSSQINQVAAKMYKDLYTGENDKVVNFWEAYQYMNTCLKPGQTEIPQILPQSAALFNTLTAQIETI